MDNEIVIDHQANDQVENVERVESQPSRGQHTDQSHQPYIDVEIQNQQDVQSEEVAAAVEEYLKQAAAHEDPTMTQIDILKSNSIEIFYNLLLLLSNVNHSTIRDFLCNEF